MDFISFLEGTSQEESTVPVPPPKVDNQQATPDTAQATPDTVSIINYLKANYPKIIFKPVKFQYNSALGFVLSDNKLVVGYINQNGTLCKLVEPIDLSTLSQKGLEETIQKIPVVSGFTEKDKERLLRFFQTSEETISKKEHNQIISELKRQLKTKDAEYRVMYDSQTQNAIAVEKTTESEQQLADLKREYDEKIRVLELAKEKLISEKGQILSELDNYKKQMEEYVKSKDIKIEELERIQKTIGDEKATIEQKLEEMLSLEHSRLADLQAAEDGDVLSDYEIKVESKQQEIDQLQQNVKQITDQLTKLRNDLNEKELQNTAIEGYAKRCYDKILTEKEQIISQIQAYNKQWNDWSDTVQSDVESYKQKLIGDLETINRNIKIVLQKRDRFASSDKEYAKLKRNLEEIRLELGKTISEQLIKLNEKDEEIRELQQFRAKYEELGVKLDETTEILANKDQQLDEKNKQLVNKSEELQRLRNELEQVRVLLAKNDKTAISSEIDYDNCYSILQNFAALNNIFYRKQEIINRLEDIIYKIDGVTNFTSLEQSVRRGIQERFEMVRDAIQKHIQFLDLEKYIKSPDFQHLRSKATRAKVSPNFCTELVNILEYWNENKMEYREQDRLLTNIYEDLSGAVRVYIRIKPLIGAEQKTKTVSLQTVDKKKQKSIVIDCKDVSGIKNKTTQTFGDFYGVFEDTFTNKDVYTGIENFPGETDDPTGLKIDTDAIVETSDSVSPGLYSVFKQVEDGYSIVIFGYGLSGSGKTFTLIGSKGAPGILHYGLANLQDVQNIKLKYLFEQYYSGMDLNFGKIRGQIHNLIREVPKLKEFARNETAEFVKGLPNNIRLDDLRIEDLYTLTDVIEKYRIKQNRIKKTPNNPVSSRSHLYLVFEIVFNTGKTGYVTIVDTAGRESPVEIFEMFVDTSKTKLASVMAPPPVGGEGLIERVRRKDIDGSYTPKHIFEVLKEGFYINETINHLVYFFNKKNYRKIRVLGQSSDVSKYDMSKYYVNPVNEETGINPINNCLTIPIMNFLDNLSNRNRSESDFKPTKFVMTCMVRQEERYCDQIFETLQFAQNVNSS